LSSTLGICLALGAAAGAAGQPPDAPAAPARTPVAPAHMPAAPAAPPRAASAPVAPARASGAAAALPVFVPARRFTLAWMHSIELVRWEEDYEVHAADDERGVGTASAADTPHADGAADRAPPPQLRALRSRVRGSGAGMEPGLDAVLRDGWFEFHPAQRMHDSLWLTRSPYSADYELCVDGQACRPLSAWLPSDGWRTRLWPCRG
jgi:hypothetical protein